jgi:hypothetical protein
VPACPPACSELALDWVPLDDDLISLEMPLAFKVAACLRACLPACLPACTEVAADLPWLWQ